MRRLCVALMVSGALAQAGCNAPAPDAAGSRKPRAAAEGAGGFEAGTSPAGSATDAGALGTAALRLAGLDAGDGDPVWARHAEEMDELWDEAERRHLRAMRDWSRSTLAPRLPEPGLPLFYPFGGPDFLSSFLFFPDAPTHVLVGLQRPGRLPRPETLSADVLAAELSRLRSGFASLVEAGYFQQTDMDADFAADRLDGLLPVLYIFLTRTGHRPVAVRHLGLDEDGRLTEPAGEANAVLVEYVREDSREVRSVFYFAQDLSDAGLVEKRPEFLRYLERLGPWNAFMKSAVYLLHMDGFSALRGTLLSKSRTILQDDSGLPHRDLATGPWNLDYFGAYTRALPVYQEWFQEDLKAVFEEGAALLPLDFAIGYHSQIGEGCLILAHRRSAP